MRLTDRSVAALKAKAERYDVWQDGRTGLGVRVAPTGRKSFIYMYRFNGNARRMTFGTYPKMSLATARVRHAKAKRLLEKGTDPGAVSITARKVARAAAKTAPTFGEAVAEFIEKYAKPRQRTWKETERTLKVNCVDWLGRPIAEITKRDAYDLLDGFIADGRGYKAKRTLAWLKTMFRWCAKRDIIAASPMDAVEIDFEERHRKRFYTDAEVKKVWKAADGLGSLESGYIKLLSLLGVRKGELAGMRRSEFDDPDKPTVWIIPHERVKARKGSKPRQYIIPLPKLAQRIIRSLPRADDDLVFPGSRQGRPLDPGTPLKARVKEASKVKDWTYHASRDTMATWLKDQGHSEYERGLVLNHSESGVTSKYSHGYPVDLKRELLEKWAGHVAGLIQPKGAVRLA